MQPQSQAPEETLWSGTPSHVLNFWTYVLCGLFCWLIVPLFVAWWKYLVLKNQRYELTTERLKMTSGVFNKQREELELFRVKDLDVVQPFFLRLFAAENIRLFTSDQTTPMIVLPAIKAEHKLADVIRRQANIRRDQKRVREVDFDQIG